MNYMEILLCIGVFVCKALEIVTFTLRTIMATRNKKGLVTFLGLLNNAMGIVNIATVAVGITSSPFRVVCYALGEAVGTYIGMIMDKKLAIGSNVMTIIINKSIMDRIINKLRFGRFAYYNDVIVGAITWKYDKHDDIITVYIMTITVLKDFQRFGIGSQLVQELIRLHKNIKEIESISLHVQVCNDLAMKFYTKNGFETVAKFDDYYTDIEPKGAYYLKKFLHKNTEEKKEEKKAEA